MKTAERIVLVVIALTLIGGGILIYLAVSHEQKEVREAVARGEYEIKNADEKESVESEDWREYFPVLVPMTIGSVTVQASIADSLPERIKGLSDTPYLPKGVVKLFAFGAAGEHAIWMKDMNYPIDIIWTNKEGVIVHVEEKVSPKTYPDSFGSPKPAWYVIETNAGFVEENSLTVGDEVVIPISE